MTIVRKDTIFLRSWLSQKHSNPSTPAKGTGSQRRLKTSLVQMTPPSRNGIAVSGARTTLPLEEDVPPIVTAKRPSTIHENDGVSQSRRLSLKMSKSISLASTKTVQSSGKSRSSSIRSRSNTGSVKSQKLNLGGKDDAEANESDYDADEEPSLKCQHVSPVIDAELVMLRKAQFSGYNLLYDQIRDFNEPVEV